MRRILGILTGLASIFFAFYTVRLLIVTGFLRHVRAGGGGAFVGAAVFPVLAIAFAWVTLRLWRRVVSSAA